MCCRNEPFKKRVRLMWFAVKFGMELAANEERVFSQFDDFHQLAVRRKAAEDKTGLLELIAISVVELVSVAVAFVYYKSAVKPLGSGSHYQLAWLAAQPHGTAFVSDPGLAVQHGDDRIRRLGIEFGRVGVVQLQ